MRALDGTASPLEIRGLKVGHAQDLQGLTGVTVVIAEQGATGGVSVLGGAPGTRETDLLRPGYTVGVVHAVFLAGGSAFGLDCARGVVRYLEERGVGFEAPPARVPIVTGAVIFDLDIGDPAARPTAEMGYLAATAAEPVNACRGNVGAGTGATVGKLHGRSLAMKSGLGIAFGEAEGCRMMALVVVNAVGDVYDPESGHIVAGAYDMQKGDFVSRKIQGVRCERGESLFGRGESGGTALCNTTVGVVAVDARLTKEEVSRLALMAQAGLARVIRPAFTPYDGDTMFALATGQSERAMPDQRLERFRLLTSLGILAQDLVAAAVLDAVKAADSAGGLPSFKEILAGRGSSR